MVGAVHFSTWLACPGKTEQGENSYSWRASLFSSRRKGTADLNVSSYLSGTPLTLLFRGGDSEGVERGQELSSE